ncbi:MAG: hypothetical protein QW270_06545 [Candidatus Bathyarchaeia archaeon]
MERLSLNMAKSFLGKNVNLHLKDGSVIVNVHLLEIIRDEFKRETFVKCIPYKRRNEFRIPLKSIAWMETLNLNMFLTGEEN